MTTIGEPSVGLRELRHHTSEVIARVRNRSASARADASRRLSSSISEPICGLLPPYTTVEDQVADQSAIRQSCWPEVPSEELHPKRMTRFVIPAGIVSWQEVRCRRRVLYIFVIH